MYENNPRNKSITFEVVGLRTNGNQHMIYDATEGKYYVSSTVAARELGCSISNISACLRGKIRTAYGHRFMRVNSAMETALLTMAKRTNHEKGDAIPKGKATVCTEKEARRQAKQEAEAKRRTEKVVARATETLRQLRVERKYISEKIGQIARDIDDLRLKLSKVDEDIAATESELRRLKGE